MNSVIVIPARFGSSRYPGKPIVPLTGAGGRAKPLIQRSYEAALKVAGPSAVYVATDDERIARTCAGFGARVILTSPDCRNGTERCAEAVSQIGEVDLVINFQGDALLTPPAYVEALLARVEQGKGIEVATPAVRLRSDEVRELQMAESKGVVGGTSVVTNQAGEALYFSKRLIPHMPDGALAGDWSPVQFHVGVYAYRPESLRAYAAAPESELERLEGLEQLRFFETGTPIAVVGVEPPGFRLRELNNPEDVPVIERALCDLGIE